MADPYQLPELVETRLSSLDWPVIHLADVGLRDAGQVAPALILIPYELRVIENGDDVVVQESLILAAIVRSVNQKSGQQARQQAGPMLTAAALLLNSWQPTDEYLPLQLESPPQPLIEPGFVAYFLQYSTNYSLE